MSLKSFGDVLTALSPEKLEVLKAALRTHVELLSSPTSADRDADPVKADADLLLVQEMMRDMESSDSAPNAAPHDSCFGQAPGDDVWPRAIKVAVIASDSWGTPTFLMSEHVVTEEEYDNGEHYERAKEEAGEMEYEGPMSAFDSRDFASRQIGQLLAFFGRERQIPVDSPEIKAESSASAEVPDSDLPPDDSEDCQNQSPG